MAMRRTSSHISHWFSWPLEWGSCACRFCKLVSLQFFKQWGEWSNDKGLTFLSSFSKNAIWIYIFGDITSGCPTKVWNTVKIAQPQQVMCEFYCAHHDHVPSTIPTHSLLSLGAHHEPLLEKNIMCSSWKDEGQRNSTQGTNKTHKVVQVTCTKKSDQSKTNDQKRSKASSGGVRRNGLDRNGKCHVSGVTPLTTIATNIQQIFCCSPFQ